MVRINLLGERTDNTRLHAWQILGFGVSVVATVAVCVLCQLNAGQEVTLLENEKQILDKQLADLKKITKQVADLELKKRSLREHIITISNLRAKKSGPVHVMDDLNTALPERAWLTSVKDKSGSLELLGVALDDQTIASFMKALEGSKYFGEISLVEAKQALVNDVKLKQFAILAEMKNPRVQEMPKQEASIAQALVADNEAADKAKSKKEKGKKLDI